MVLSGEVGDTPVSGASVIRQLPPNSQPGAGNREIVTRVGFDHKKKPRRFV